MKTRKTTLVEVVRLFLVLGVVVIGEVKRLLATNRYQSLRAASWTLNRLDRLAK